MKEEEGGKQPTTSFGGIFHFTFCIFILIPFGRAIGAVVAQLLYTETVGGSNPSSPTSSSPERSEKRRLPRRSEAQTGERTATLRASAWQASQRSLSKNRGSTLKAGWMIPRGFGLRQPSAALHRPPCGEKVAEGCRSPRRYRAIRSPKLSSWPQIFLNRPSSLSGLAQDFLLVIERQESWRV